MDKSKTLKNGINLEGYNGEGRRLTEEETMHAIKLHRNSLKKTEDYDMLAKEVNFDVEGAAQQVVKNTDRF